MQSITTIGLDIAKSVFQVHGVDAAGQVVVRRQLKRRHVLAFFEKLPPCLVGIEACASSHHWSRELHALGHTVRLMPPAYVKPYVKRQKNDVTDAEAICEAVTRPSMRFVPTKTSRATGLSGASSCAPSIHSPADGCHQLDPRLPCRVRDRRPCRAQGRRAPAGSRRRYSRPPAPGDSPRVCCCTRRSVAGLEGPDTEVRPMHHRLASIECDEQAARRASRRRPAPGHGAGRERRRSQGLPIRTRLLSLDRPGSEAELERRQGQAWQHQQARRSLSA